jgi:hypothetical protein
MITRYNTIFKHEFCSVLAKILLVNKQAPLSNKTPQRGLKEYAPWGFKVVLYIENFFS